ncbi:hypothetical protein GmarT_02850 [Gimesia maris]|uniref:Uncharacterized protein n=1 Tax=Gimesia maris TaxID=122 RepID=A0ABX5YFJ4_9PLAN|nr:hypothetical protein GmarT_02850 [Gimesia maris]
MDQLKSGSGLTVNPKIFNVQYFNLNGCGLFWYLLSGVKFKVFLSARILIL